MACQNTRDFHMHFHAHPVASWLNMVKPLFSLNLSVNQSRPFRAFRSVPELMLSSTAQENITVIRKPVHLDSKRPLNILAKVTRCQGQA